MYQAILTLLNVYLFGKTLKSATDRNAWLERWQKEAGIRPVSASGTSFNFNETKSVEGQGGAAFKAFVDSLKLSENPELNDAMVRRMAERLSEKTNWQCAMMRSITEAGKGPWVGSCGAEKLGMVVAIKRMEEVTEAKGDDEVVFN